MQTAKRERSWPEAQGDVFDSRFADWLQLRAQLFAMEQDDDVNADDYDSKHSDLSQRLDDAARLAITTHADTAWRAWKKFEILEAALNQDEGDPRWVDFRPMWMVAAIKADLASLGIGDRS